MTALEQAQNQQARLGVRKTAEYRKRAQYDSVPCRELAYRVLIGDSDVIAQSMAECLQQCECSTPCSTFMDAWQLNQDRILANA